MPRTDLLTQPQEHVLALISAGSAASAAAEAAGVHRNTVGNWQRSSPAFREALNQAGYDQVLFWREQAQKLAAAALDTINAILEDPSRSLRHPPESRLGHPRPCRRAAAHVSERLLWSSGLARHHGPGLRQPHLRCRAPARSNRRIDVQPCTTHLGAAKPGRTHDSTPTA